MARTNLSKNANAVTIYLRVSTDEQGKSGLGLDAQQDLCQRVASELGLEVVGVFTDIVSGKSNPTEREGFSAAIKNCQTIGGRLMVGKLDRLSRDVYYISSFVNGFMVKNTPRLLIADNPNASEFEINIRASISQEERRMISERTKAALAVKKSQGAELGKVGRTVAHENARSSTELAIARAKELLSQDYGYQRIAETLNNEGFVTSRGSAWSKQALYKRLSAQLAV
jgi:DNA invertase Pin-like site-specific DNA recombinase